MDSGTKPVIHIEKWAFIERPNEGEFFVADPVGNFLAGLTTGPFSHRLYSSRIVALHDTDEVETQTHRYILGEADWDYAAWYYAKTHNLQEGPLSA